MEADLRPMENGGQHAELTSRVIRVFYDVYNELGYGFLEVVYQKAMQIALTEAGFQVGVEVGIPVMFRGHEVGRFRADLLVDDVVLLELKTCEELTRQHQAQLTHYLRSTAVEVGLLMNFGPAPRLKRVVMSNAMKGAELRAKAFAKVPGRVGVVDLMATGRAVS